MLFLFLYYFYSMKALFWRSQLLLFVCLFVFFDACILVCVCACVEGKIGVFHCCCSPPLFFSTSFQGLLIFELLVVFAPCPPCFLFLLFFCLFSRRKDSFSFLAIVCVCVCVCYCCLRRGASKSLNSFFFRCPLSLPLSLALPHFHFLSFFFCFSVSLQSVAE